jgi:hypothetical protein
MESWCPEGRGKDFALRDNGTITASPEWPGAEPEFQAPATTCGVAPTT